MPRMRPASSTETVRGFVSGNSSIRSSMVAVELSRADFALGLASGSDIKAAPFLLWVVIIHVYHILVALSSNWLILFAKLVDYFQPACRFTPAFLSRGSAQVRPRGDQGRPGV